MLRRSLLALSLALTLRPAPALAVPPTNTQKCEADVEKASGKFAQCKLNAESVFAKSGDAGKLSDALAKCSTNLQTAFGKLPAKYPGACPMTEPVAAFDTYLTQCSDDTTAAAGGAALPDYVGELASCNTNLTTAQSSLTMCQGALATCQATPKGQITKTGQTTCWDSTGTVVPCAGTGQDGDLQKGLALAYTDNGDGTITDSNTGLMWEKLSNDGSIHDKDDYYTWDQAFSVKIAALNTGAGFAGHTDWRLPNFKELYSLAYDDGLYLAVPPLFNSNCGLGCSVTTCSCTNYEYWSSSSNRGYPQAAFGAVFTDGGAPVAYIKTAPKGVRAVRGG